MRVFDITTNSIVRSAEIALGLELDVSAHPCLRAPDVSMVAKLVFHGAKKDTAHVDVGLSDEAVYQSVSCFHEQLTRSYVQALAGVQQS